MRTATIVHSLIALGFVAACDRSTDEKQVVGTPKPVETAEPAPRDVDVDVDVDDEDFDLHEERTALTRWVQEQAREVDAKIQELERRGDMESRDVVSMLRAKRDQALGKMRELGTRTARNWEDFEDDVERAWNELEGDIDEEMR